MNYKQYVHRNKPQDILRFRESESSDTEVHQWFVYLKLH